MFIDPINAWFTGRRGVATSQLRTGSTLKLERMETRDVPAFLIGGHLNIVGTDATDEVHVVQVSDVVQVNHNGMVQHFLAGGITGQVRFWGFGGNDRFHAGNVTRPCFVDGGAGNDVISGGSRDNQLFGGSESDVTYGAGGNDIIRGGDGDDMLDGGRGEDVLYGEGGADILVGGGENYILLGGKIRDLLRGGDGDAWLYGEEGDDHIFGGASVDVAFGGAGADQFWEVGNGRKEDVFVGPPTRSQSVLVGVQDREFFDIVWS